jgi:hypothetical protein
VWFFTLLLASLVGLVAAYLVPPGESGSRPGACGGSVSLALGLLSIAGWLVVKKKQGAGEIG